MKHTVELFSDYRLKAKIGKGTFGEVWSAINIETREKVAIKMSTTPKGPAILLAEYNMMNSLDHPNIMKASAIYHSAASAHIIMPFYEADLFNYTMNNEGLFKEKTLKVILNDICGAIKHMHDKDVVHRDIKPENIMMDGNCKFVLCDFGFAEKEDYMTTSKLLGTLAFLSPELIKGIHRDNEAKFTVGKPADIYALGITLFCIATKTNGVPYMSTKKMMRYLEDPDMLDEVDKLKNRSEKFKSLLRGMLDPNPISRLSVAEVMTHDFMTSV
jgi:serine/threonine protein kinase